MVQSRLDVVIVGGGIGGLFAANALAAQGFAVAVYEQAPAIGEIAAGVFRIGRLPRACAAWSRSRLAGRPLADVARQREALPRLPRARRKADQLCRIRADRRADEGILVGSRRSRCSSAGLCGLGSAHRAVVEGSSADVPMGAV